MAGNYEMLYMYQAPICRLKKLCQDYAFMYTRVFKAFFPAHSIVIPYSEVIK